MIERDKIGTLKMDFTLRSFKIFNLDKSVDLYLYMCCQVKKNRYTNS
jgi:hypothetical protein